MPGITTCLLVLPRIRRTKGFSWMCRIRNCFVLQSLLTNISHPERAGCQVSWLILYRPLISLSRCRLSQYTTPKIGSWHPKRAECRSWLKNNWIELSKPCPRYCIPAFTYSYQLCILMVLIYIYIYYKYDLIYGASIYWYKELRGSFSYSTSNSFALSD